MHYLVGTHFAGDVFWFTPEHTLCTNAKRARRFIHYAEARQAKLFAQRRHDKAVQTGTPPTRFFVRLVHNSKMRPNTRRS